MARGGKRTGAGRPAGSSNKPKLQDYWTEEDIAKYFEHLRKTYKKSDRLTQFVGEHIMGKATQPISNDNGEPFKLSFDPIFNAPPRKAKANSK